jgi:hypothetical protein
LGGPVLRADWTRSTGNTILTPENDTGFKPVLFHTLSAGCRQCKEPDDTIRWL